MPNRVVHFEMQAKDKDRAKKFYTEAFGWKMEEMGGEYGNYVVMQSGDPMPDPKDHGINGGMIPVQDKQWNAFSCTISVDDIEKAVSDIKTAGGTILDGPMDIPSIGKYALCKDTEDNFFSILQPSEEMLEEKAN